MEVSVFPENDELFIFNSYNKTIEFSIKIEGYSKYFEIDFNVNLNFKKSKPSVLISNLIKCLVYKTIISFKTDRRFDNQGKKFDNKIIESTIILLSDLLNKSMLNFDKVYLYNELNELKNHNKRLIKLQHNLDKNFSKKLKFYESAVERLKRDFEKDKIDLPKKLNNIKNKINQTKKEIKLYV